MLNTGTELKQSWPLSTRIKFVVFWKQRLSTLTTGFPFTEFELNVCLGLISGGSLSSPRSRFLNMHLNKQVWIASL